MACLSRLVRHRLRCWPREGASTAPEAPPTALGRLEGRPRVSAPAPPWPRRGRLRLHEVAFPEEITGLGRPTKTRRGRHIAVSGVAFPF